jgi:hypothetical protein
MTADTFIANFSRARRSPDGRILGGDQKTPVTPDLPLVKPGYPIPRIIQGDRLHASIRVTSVSRRCIALRQGYLCWCATRVLLKRSRRD